MFGISESLQRNQAGTRDNGAGKSPSSGSFRFPAMVDLQHTSSVLMGHFGCSGGARPHSARIQTEVAKWAHLAQLAPSRLQGTNGEAVVNVITAPEQRGHYAYARLPLRVIRGHWGR